VSTDDPVDASEHDFPDALGHAELDLPGCEARRRRLLAGEHPELGVGDCPDRGFGRFIVGLSAPSVVHRAMKSPGCDGYPAASFSSRSWLRTCGLP